jgi:membrane-bound serine protease (ClpP class)
MSIGPNVALVLTILGLLAIYWEFLRPGRIYPGTLGAASLLWGAWSLWQLSPTPAGLQWLAAAAVLFLVESCWNTRYLAGVAATAALIVGASRLFTGPRQIVFYLALPLGLAFGAVTIWLAAAAKRARRNKRSDL